MEIIIILSILGLLFIFLANYNLVKEAKNYLSDLGAINLKLLFFPYLSAELIRNGLRVKIWVSGLRRNFKLYISLPAKTEGYLRLWVPDWFDKILASKLENGLAQEFEDPLWVKKVLNKITLNSLEKFFKDTGIQSFEIRKGELRCSWQIRNKISHIHKVNIYNALDQLREYSYLLTETPKSTDKEALRSWLSFKLPILLTVLFFLLALIGNFWKFIPLCMLDLLYLGLKIFTFLYFLYLSLVLFFVGNKSFFSRIFLNSFLSFMILYLFTSLFFLTFINGKFDTSKPEIKRDIIVSKHISLKRGKGIILKELHSQKKYCEPLTVSDSFYERAKVGDRVEYETKAGFLGVEWRYSSFRLLNP